MAEDRQIVLKEHTGMQGTGVIVVTGWAEHAGEQQAVLSNGEHLSLSTIAADLASSVTTWIIQESLHQHEVLTNLNPSSVNTVRLLSFLRNGGRVLFPAAILRIGRATSQIPTWAKCE